MMSLKKLIVLGMAKRSVEEFERVNEHPMECQENYVLKLARMNRNTLFGRRCKLDRVRCIEDYQRLVPVHDYGALGKYMKLIMRGDADVLFAGRPIWWARTSGTTSQPKLIPITYEMTKYISETGSRLLYSFIMENPRENLDTVSGKLFFLRAPSRVADVNGVPVGYISGISGETQSRFARRMVVPSNEVSELSNWQDKFYRAILETVGQNVTMIVGVAPMLMSMFRRMAEEYPEHLLKDLKNDEVRARIKQAIRKGGDRLMPKDCWQNLKLFCPSSASMKPYISTYEELFGDVPIREAYGATEGQFGQGDGRDEGVLLNLDRYFFEFIPFESGKAASEDTEARGTHQREDAENRLTVSELKIRSLYEVLVTTPFGLYSYKIGDILRLESKNPYRFTIAGRTKMTLNVFGEKVCEEHVTAALRAAEESTKSVVSEYSCMPIGEQVGGPRYLMCVEFIKAPRNKSRFIRVWDMKLQEVAPGYECFRANDTMLKAPEIVTLARGAFQKYEQERMKNLYAVGQLKPRHIDNTGDLLSQLKLLTEAR